MSKMRWGDFDDDDALPLKSVTGPDSEGIKVIIDYYRNDKGDAIKRVTKVKIAKVEKKVYKVTHERRQWLKFGAATREGNEGVTMRMIEEIPFERTKSFKSKEEEKKAAQSTATLLKDGAASALIGQNLRDVLERKRKERRLKEARGEMPEAERPPEEDVVAGPAAMPQVGKGSYVPPHLKARASGESMPQRRREENSVRVSNLAGEATEQDLKDLFGRVGSVTRVYIAYDRESGASRGFAFVNYVRREDAQRAIDTLNGHGYANLILQVEWAERRESK